MQSPRDGEKVVFVQCIISNHGYQRVKHYEFDSGTCLVSKHGMVPTLVQLHRK